MPRIVEVRAGGRTSSWQASVSSNADLDFGSDEFILERYCFSGVDTNDFVGCFVVGGSCGYDQAILLSFLGGGFVVAAPAAGCCFEGTDGGGHYGNDKNLRSRAWWSESIGILTSKTVHAYASTWKHFRKIIGVVDAGVRDVMPHAENASLADTYVLVQLQDLSDADAMHVVAW
jgi:hypothetical protein